jgi:hypothetical protein
MIGKSEDRFSESIMRLKSFKAQSVQPETIAL